MQQQRKRSPCLNLSAILLVMALIATVASVPTSVLVQNSELASNSNNNNNHNGNGNGNGNNKQHNNIFSSGNYNTNIDNNMMAKVKRSSNNAKESMPNSAVLDKKSSPEIVPASFNAPPPQPSTVVVASLPASAGNSLPTNGEIINSAIAAGLTAAAVEAAAAAANQRELEELQQQAQLYGDDFYGNRAESTPTLLHKRGINAQQYLYGPEAGVGAGGLSGGYGSADFYNPYLSAASSADAGLVGVPNGVWTDEVDPAIVYTDLQDLNDYAPAMRAPTYRSKAYDNLQNLLNSEAYLEPVVLPLQYPSRYYGAGDAERNKRSNYNKYNKYADLRLKRDTKLTPADMLALVALVEAGERARKDTDADATGAYIYPAPAAAVDTYNNPKGYYGQNSYDYPATADDVDYNGVGGGVGVGGGSGAWIDPNVVDYYAVPVNMEAVPKYEMQPREHKYGGNRYSPKRYMVAKKKRSLGKFLNEPIGKPGNAYAGETYF